MRGGGGRAEQELSGNFGPGATLPDDVSSKVFAFPPARVRGRDGLRAREKSGGHPRKRTGSSFLYTREHGAIPFEKQCSPVKMQRQKSLIREARMSMSMARPRRLSEVGQTPSSAPDRDMVASQETEFIG